MKLVCIGLIVIGTIGLHASSRAERAAAQADASCSARSDCADASVVR